MTEHSIAWINKMYEIITREQFEQNLMQLSIQGVPKENIEKMRSEFERQFKTDAEKAKDEPSLLGLKRFGIYVGKKSKTKVINK